MNPVKPPKPQFVVRRSIRRDADGAEHPTPFVRHGHLGRNDACPCGCGQKAKRCEVGQGVLEQQRWA